MILLTRPQLRSVRDLFRRSALGIAHRGPLPPLLLHADGDLVRVQYVSADLAVEHVLPAAGPSAGSAALPLDALAELGGRGEALLALDSTAPGRTIVRWTDRGIPQCREYAIPDRPQPGAFPEGPADWSEVPGNLLDALAAATAGSTRYALDCLLLRGDGAVVATDGHQALVRGGFAFPWRDDLLVAGTPLFAVRDLPRDRPWCVGRTESHVLLRGDATTIALAIRTGVRFPRVDDIFPEPTAAMARLRLDPADAAYLAEALGRLPGADAPLAPVTVDLNGHVAVRARGTTEAAATEVVLSRSAYTGTPTRFGTDRALLDRALRLGFAEVEVGEPGVPLVCRSGALAYAWQPLAADAIIPADAVATRVESPAGPPATPSPLGATPTDAITVPSSPPATVAGRHRGLESRTLAATPTRHTSAAPLRTATPDESPTNGLAALVREAEALHEALGSARDRSRRLVVALKHQRKQARLMATTLRSLRQLGLPEVVG